MIRLFVIDDHPAISRGLGLLLREENDGIEVVGNASDVKGAVGNLTKEDFEIFLLDLHLADSNPRKNVATIKELFPEKKIVIYTMDDSSLWVNAMKTSNVDGYLTKDLDMAVFISSIKKINDGEKLFPEGCKSVHPISPSDTTLTRLQIKILGLLIEGLKIKEIAENDEVKEIAEECHCKIDAFKVDYLLKKIRCQFHVKNNAELAAVWSKITD